MRNQLLVVVSFAFLFGCGVEAGSAEFEIVYDPCEPVVLLPIDTATSAERASILDAIGMWSAVDGPMMTLEPIAGAQSIPIGFEKAAPVFYGLYRDDIGDVLINTELDDDYGRAITIAHELGHAFGLRHNKVTDSVMQSGNLTVPPSPGDVAAIAEFAGGACPPTASDELD